MAAAEPGTPEYTRRQEEIEAVMAGLATGLRVRGDGSYSPPEGIHRVSAGGTLTSYRTTCAFYRRSDLLNRLTQLIISPYTDEMREQADRVEARIVQILLDEPKVKDRRR
jgi:hypothetical protein